MITLVHYCTSVISHHLFVLFQFLFLETEVVNIFYLCGMFLTTPHRDNYSVHLSPGGKQLKCSTKNDKNVRVLHQV